MVVDVWFEPWHLWRAAAALERNVPLGTNAVGDQARHLVELSLVVAPLCHRQRDRMRSENQASARPMDFFDTGDDRIDETGMVVIEAQLVEARSVVAHRFARLGKVLAVLATAAVRRERRGGKHERIGHTVVTHLRDRVSQVGLPVAVAEVDRQLNAHRVEFAAQRVDQRFVLIVDR